MTQEYEPIELTDDTPEPKDEGTYFLYAPSIAPNLVSIYHSSDGWELADVADETVTWPELIKGRNMKEKITIQSLAAHDAQIRAAALDFANTEQIDNGEELLNEALSEAVKEYLLYGAHPLSTEEDSDDIWDDCDLFNLRLTNGDVIDCSELAAEVLDALKRYLKGQPTLQSTPVKEQKQ